MEDAVDGGSSGTLVSQIPIADTKDHDTHDLDAPQIAAQLPWDDDSAPKNVAPPPDSVAAFMRNELETELDGGDVVHRTGPWIVASSSRAWGTARWQKEKIMGILWPRE